MSISFKRLLYIGISILGLIGILFYSSPEIKTKAVYFGFKGFNYIYCNINKIFLGRPLPICYVNDQHVSEIISNPPAWITRQITNDFQAYTKFSASDTQRTFDMLSDVNAVVKVTLKNNQVLFTEKDGSKLNGSPEFALEIYRPIFQYALQKKYVREVTFLLRFCDLFPSLPRNITIADLTPILAAAKDVSKPTEKDMILIPDWMNLNSWSKLKPRLSTARDTLPWSKKIDKILWRGGYADVTGYRKKVVEFSKGGASKFLDAKFTEGYDENFMLPEEQLAYRFQLSTDGHTAPWERPVWQLYSNCVMVKQQSPRIQWYYNAISPGQHYIEVTDNIEELAPAMTKYTDKALQQMSKNAHEFVEKNLSTDAMVAYIILVLQKIEKMQNAGVES